MPTIQIPADHVQQDCIQLLCICNSKQFTDQTARDLDFFGTTIQKSIEDYFALEYAAAYCGTSQTIWNYITYYGLYLLQFANNEICEAAGCVRSHLIKLNRKLTSLKPTAASIIEFK